MLSLHLQEIEDAAARDGVHTFQTQMEIVVLSLLDENPGTALGQIEEARAVTIAAVDRMALPALSLIESDKARRVAQALLTHSFARIRILIESPPDDEPLNGGSH